MELAKPVFDVGLFTLDPAATMAFWEKEAGAFLDSHIVIREGHEQDRMNLSGSMLKINGVATLNGPAAGGYARVVVASDAAAEARSLADGDGNKVSMVPRGHMGIDQIAICVKVRSLDAHVRYYRDVLGFEQVSPGVFQIGQGKVILEEDPAATDQSAAELAVVGWRYITLECADIAAAFADYVAQGGKVSVPVQQMANNLVRFALVRDPDGNWIEMVQRRAPDSPFPPL